MENQQYRLDFGHFVSICHILRGAENKKRMNVFTKKACFITQTKHMMKKTSSMLILDNVPAC